MIFWLTVFVLGISLVLMNYVRNKQRDKARHRRERMQEKQEALLDSLRRRKQQEEENKNED
jgi:hypothetical protein